MSRSESMRAVQVPEPGSEFEIVERSLPEPGPEEVRVSVTACGICGGDIHVREGAEELGIDIDYPRVPGHEIVGRVDATGEDITQWNEGDRVGVGWYGGYCFTCEACRRGDFMSCENALITGMHRDGGYAEYTLARPEALAAIPDDLDSADAAPLLCAGLTMFNALRNTETQPGDLVAVGGIGGLGHLALQYAHQAGFETVAVSRGTEKRPEAFELGADHYIDSEAEDPASKLEALGGADVVLSTAPASDAVEAVLSGLDTDGEVVALGIPEQPVPVELPELVENRGSISGWSAGTARDAEDTLQFSDLRDIAPEIETFDLSNAEEAYRAMTTNDVRFRAVLEP